MVLGSMKGAKKEKGNVSQHDQQQKKGMKREDMKQFKESLKNQKKLLENIQITNPARSIGSKLLIIFFISIVCCVLAVGLISYSMTKGLIQKNVSEASAQTIKQVSENIDTVMGSYVDTSFQLMFDATITNQANILFTSKDTFGVLQANREISDKLSNFLLGNTIIRNIAIIPVSGGASPFVAGAITSTSKSLEELQATEWFQATVSGGGTANWIHPQAEGILEANPYETIALARVVKNFSDDSKSYVILLEFFANNLFEIIKTVDFGEGSKVFIVNNDNDFVFTLNSELYGEESDIVIPTETSEELEGSRNVIDADNKDYLAVYKTIDVFDNWRLIGAIPVENLASQAAPIRNLTIITVIVAAIIAIGVGMFVVMLVGKPLVHLSNLMQKGAMGNLTVRSSLRHRKDEIGELSDNFNEMMQQISHLASQTTYSAAEVLKTAVELTDASQKTAVAAKEIAVATDEIANGATSLAVEAEKGTDLTANINEQMVQVNEYNVTMTQSAEEVETASLQGTAHMGLLIEKTGATEQMTREMVDKVTALKESTLSIVKILDVLNNVTKQTNILSLNATIEAARAGAAGKGFMVVADEIRQLADQSKQSIEVVGQITAQISTEIEETVTVMLEAYPIFQEQIESVKEANQLFLTVQAQMDHFKQNLVQVTDSIGVLNQSQSTLNDSMNNVSAVAQQSSATSEEVASLSTEQLSISQNLVQLSTTLESVSNGLKDSLSKFKI